MGGGKRKKWDPDKHCYIDSAIPGWREQVEPLRQDSLFWHSIWVSLGCPNSGKLFELHKHVRNRYHYAVRKCKAVADSTRLAKLLEASESGDAELLKEMKAVKGANRQHTKVADTVDGAVGKEAVSEKFKEVYEALYNSAESAEEMVGIKEKLSNIIGVGSMDQVSRVTGAVVKEACTRMKPGKADVTGAFTSDILLNGPDSLFDSLAGVFRSFLVHGDVTLELLSCAFLPLYKGGLKNPNSSDSYRAIAGSSQILKLLDNVIILLWGDLLGSDTLQFGFRKGTSTTQCSWLVMETASHFLRQGTPIIATLLDCSKAFDMCRFSTLFQKLMDMDLPPIVIRLLAYVYEEQAGCVQWDGIRSSKFSITNGTRQGSVLSPTLFSVYVDDLLKELRQLGLGCHVGGVWVGAAGYADDLILLAPSRTAMARMLNVCEQYAERHNLQFSTDPNPSKSKSKCLYMCGYPDPVYPNPLKLCGEDLPWVQHAVHLGHELHQLCSMEYDVKIKRAQFIETAMDIRDTFKFARPQEIVRATQVYACHWYGAMLWDLYGEKVGQLCRAWNTSVKLAWGLPRSTHTYIVENLLVGGSMTVKQQLVGRFVNFFRSLLVSRSPEVQVVANIAGRCARSTTGSNLLHIERETLLDPWTTPAWKVCTSISKSEVPEQEKWRLIYLKKLLLARRQLESSCEETQEVTALIDSLDRLININFYPINVNLEF